MLAYSDFLFDFKFHLMINFIEELRWRGMLHDITPGADEHLSEQMRTGYIGFDPTAPSLGIGNYVQIMLLTLFQKAGHRPIALVGGATGRIGDPSGKDKERELKNYDEIENNLERQRQQFFKFLNFDEGDNKALLLNNYDFYTNMNALDFLRDVGKTITVSYMLGKDSVQRRIETGISFTEFSYQLLQGYDFQCIYQQYGGTIQMGGSDQWGNITTGTEFIRRNLSGKAYAITTPLLTKADGSKFGKSEGGNIWLDPTMTSPYKFYQFWLNADDRDITKFLRYFTFRSREEVEALEQQYTETPQVLKQTLAEELTARIHSKEDYANVKNVTELLFGRNADKQQLLSLSENALATVAEEIPSFEVPKSVFATGVNVVDLLAEHTQVLNSKGDVRRAIQGNAISINKDKITDHSATINHEVLLHGKYMMIENGKKNKFILKVSQ